MIMKRSLFLLFLAAAAASLQAEVFYFTGRGESDVWADENNWNRKTISGEPGIPGPDDAVRFPGASVLRITNEITVANFQNGVDGTARGPAKVIIDGGTLRTTAKADYNSVSYNCPASFIVQNGGSATFACNLIAGRQGVGGGTMVIYDGTVRVDASYQHNEGNSQIESRTTIYGGGVLDVNSLKLNAGVLDIAQGTLIVRTGYLLQIEEWIKAGRIIAMSGAEGWTVRATIDPDTGWIKIVAVSPATVG